MKFLYYFLGVLITLFSCQNSVSPTDKEKDISSENVDTIPAIESKVNDQWRKGDYLLNVWADFDAPDCYRIEKLESLSLGGNRLTEIPQSVSELDQLSFCDFAKNQLTEFPHAVLGCENLFTLWLHENPLTSIPDQLGDLPELAHLMVDLDKIDPSDIEKLKGKKPKLRIVDNN